MGLPATLADGADTEEAPEIPALASLFPQPLSASKTIQEFPYEALAEKRSQFYYCYKPGTLPPPQGC